MDNSASTTLKFSDKVVIITGSGTGIGQSVAKRFAELGANIVIMGRRKEPLDQTVELLKTIMKNTGSNASVRAFSGVDVADEEGINNMFKSIGEEFGRVDIIVNNAGVSGPVKTFTNADFQEFKDCVSIHLTGTFWTSLKGIEYMNSGSKIITIATFFTEENKYEQRPYRFRTPYTASQGAKNRLAEALAWELVEKGIKSISTNPGPVHSDRIYKTVYPKAAAEFLRIGGYPGLSSVEVEMAATKALPLLGEEKSVISNGLAEISKELYLSRNSDKNNNNNASESLANDSEDSLLNIIDGMLTKIQEIAEKVQNNTSKMIVDNEFLAQSDVADMVVTLSDDKISKLINGRVIPNDRVFYPVKPIIGTTIDNFNSSFENYNQNIKDKVIVITITSSKERDILRAKRLAENLNLLEAKQVVILTRNTNDIEQFKDFHSHSIDLLNEEHVKRIFNTVRTKFGRLDYLIHITGDYDYNKSFLDLSRSEWDSLVDNFINIPGLITKESVNTMVPGGLTEPTQFKDANGVVVIIGPDSPTGKKISGLIRSRSEVFRGALRPYNATVNQELSDVLKSNIKSYLIFPGNLDGKTSDEEKLKNSVISLIAGTCFSRHETIFYPDEKE